MCSVSDKNPSASVGSQTAPNLSNLSKCSYLSLQMLHGTGYNLPTFALNKMDNFVYKYTKNIRETHPVLLGILGEAELVGDMHLLSSSKLRRCAPGIEI